MSAQAVRLSNVDINNALENKDFEVLFQPIFDLSNGALARMETFVRWRHPSLGVLPPGAFISFFESQGRMSELTRYILDTALERYSEWRGPFAPGFSVNLSLADLADDSFTEHLTSAIEAIEFPADLITLECPMPAVDTDIEDMVDRFARLRKTGARLAIEVRGRANDFLRTVDPFPFDEIKTGGSSILRFARTVRGPGLSAISDLLDIAKKANAVTTAVGVEDQASLSALRDLGFTAAQGNHLAKVGDLNAFRPARVNSVRELLGLSTLNGDELAALFRTAAPSPMAAEGKPTAAEAVVSEGDPAPAEPAATETAEAAATPEDKEALVARARKKAKAIALAKRAKARDARKAAAIKRAKAKVARAKQEGAGETELAQDVSTDPRDLQNRIAEEFAEPAHGEDDARADGGQATVEEEISATISEGNVAPMTDATPDHDATPAQATASDDATDKDLRLKVSVGKPGVYFHPGVSVSSGAPTIHTEEMQSAQAAPTDAPAPAPLSASDEGPIDVAFVDEPAPEPQTTPVTPEPSETVLAQDAASEPVMQESVDDAAPANVGAAPDQPAEQKRRKNFLQRRYTFPPKHFWPKPWKRTWRRLTAAHEEAAAEA